MNSQDVLVSRKSTFYTYLLNTLNFDDELLSRNIINLNLRKLHK